MLFMFFIFTAALGEIIFSPFSKKITASCFSRGNEGLGLALWKTTYYLSNILGATFVGYTAEHHRTLNIWYLCAPLSLAMVVCVIIRISFNIQDNKRWG